MSEAATPELVVNTLVALTSDMISRAALAARMGQAYNGLRDYNEQFGYKKEITFEDYWAWYKRGGLAKRVIDLPCDATWRHKPEVLDDEEEGSENDFEKTWTYLDKRLSLTAWLKRSDVLQSIGCFSVLLLGTKDTDKLEQEIRPGQFKSPDDLLYVQAFSEQRINLSDGDLETDVKNKRYGLPKFYTLSMGQGMRKETQRVHHSRLLHFAEGCLENEIYGTPRLEAVFNLFLDLLKTSGGGAESYWLNAANKIKAETQDGFKLTGQSATEVKEIVSDFTHHLSSYLIGNGIRFDRLGVQTSDPSGNIDTLLMQISGTVGIPLRILTGSERGELASTQDRANWAETVMARQQSHAEPGMLRPLLNRLIELGIMPAPSEGEYLVKWKNLLELDDQQKAQLSLTRAQAASAYVGPGGETERVYAPSEFRESMGLSVEMSAEATKSIVDMGQDDDDDENNPEVQQQFRQTKRAA